MKVFDDIVNRLEDYKKEFLENGDPNIINTLAAIGKQIIWDAYESKDTGVILGNQIDAYGYGVYFNGTLRKQGYLDNNVKKHFMREEHYSEKKGRMVKGAAPDVRRHKYGRSEAMKAIKQFVPDTKGYVLFLTNAMWYSSVHETRGLKILTQSKFKALQEIKRQLGVEADLVFYNYGW